MDVRLQDKFLLFHSLRRARDGYPTPLLCRLLEPPQGVHKRLGECEAEEMVRTCCIMWGDEVRAVVLGGKIRQVKYLVVIVGEEVGDKRGTKDNPT